MIIADISGAEFDAILAGLRLLEREVKAGNVRFSDDDAIGQILTNAGEHEGLGARKIGKLAQRINENAKG